VIKILVFFVLIVACAWLEERFAQAKQKVVVRITPMVLLQRGDVKVLARWEPASDARYIGLDFTSNVGGGNSTRPIDVEQRSMEWTLRDMAPVDTGFVVTLYGERNKVLATTTARLAGPGGK
jgi:hypothetical protein